ETARHLKRSARHHKRAENSTPLAGTPACSTHLSPKAWAQNAGTTPRRSRSESSTTTQWGITDRKRPMKHENKRQVNPQRDGSSGERVAANHPPPVLYRISSQYKPYSQCGRYHPDRGQHQKSPGSNPTGLGMRRDPQGSAPP